MSELLAFVVGFSGASVVVADRHGLPRRWVRRWVAYAYTWNKDGQR